MLIECLIKRDGPTEVIVGGLKYVFSSNAYGDYVGDVVNDGAAEFLLSMPNLYRRYEPSFELTGEAVRERGRGRRKGV